MSSLPFSVSLTGGIASGKTALAERMAELGAGIVDADVIAREVVGPGQPALDEIAAAFGRGMLDAEGRLDRRRLREHVFAEPQARRRLEAIVHPRVRALARSRVAASRAPYVLLVVPLLYEHRGDYAWLDRVLVVDAPEALQLARLMARDRIDETLARAILASQASRGQRLAIADDVVCNTGDAAALADHARELHRRYMELALGGTAGVDPLS